MVTRSASYSPKLRIRQLPYRVEIAGADVFPQGFAAVAGQIRDFQGVNMLCDIGNGTMNIKRRVVFLRCMNTSALAKRHLAQILVALGRGANIIVDGHAGRTRRRPSPSPCSACAGGAGER